MTTAVRTALSRAPGFAGAAAALLLAGCLFGGGPSFSRIRGETLRTSDRAGGEALELMEQEPEVRRWVERAGKPDYVRADSSRRLFLFYLGRDQVVRFERGMLKSEYRVTPSQPIRSDDNLQFTDDDRERLGQVRMGQTQPAPQTEEQPAESGRIVRKRVGGEYYPAPSPAPTPEERP